MTQHTSPANELDAEAERVAERIRARNDWVSVDLRVLPAVAADFLGCKEASLRNRSTPVRVRIGRSVTYRIVDLLRERRIEDPAA